MQDKQQLINRLTGVNSSKNNYYSELRDTVAALKNKNAKLSMINSVTKGFHVEMPMEDMLEMVLDSLQHLYPFERLSLSLFQNGQLKLTQVYPLDSAFFPVGTIFEKTASAYWEAVQHRHPIHQLVDEMPDTYEEKKAFKALGLISTVSLPLYNGEEILGVLNIAASRVMNKEDMDLPFLQQLTDQLAVHIENTSLYGEVLRGKREWEASFSAVQDMLIVTDSTGLITRTNDAAAILLQNTAQDTSSFIQEILPQIQIEERLVSSHDNRMTIDERIYDVASYPLVQDRKGIYGIVFSMKDRTDQLHLESQLIQSGKLAAMGEMAAGVAHELNSPLTAVIGNSQLLLRQTALQAPEHQLLTDIYTCGDRCRNIVRNLLTFARQDEYTMMPFHLNDAVKQTLGLLKYQIERNQIEIETVLDPALPLFNGNKQEIEQIIINLLMNARDALLECNPTRKWIRIQTFQRQDKLVLAVSDNAGGIDADKVESIFYPFYTTKDASKGTGLGLSVSLGIAKEHGGTLQVHSVAHKESTFELVLPAQEERDDT